MQRNTMKKAKKAIFLGVVLAISAMMVIPAGSMNMKSSFGNKEKDLTNLIQPMEAMSPVMGNTAETEKIPMTFSSLATGTDIPVIATEYNDQNPAITTDGAGNILVVAELNIEFFDTDMMGRWSTDGGVTWSDDIVGWNDLGAPERPKLDYYGSSREAWGTWVPDPSESGTMHYVEFPDITDPEAGEQGWAAWYVDWSGYGFEDFDSADVACYTGELQYDPAFFGLVMATGYDDEGGKTIFMSFFEGDSAYVLHFSSSDLDFDPSKISADIDQSNGMIYYTHEFENDPEIGSGTALWYHQLVANPDWWKGSWYYWRITNITNPDVVADGGYCYVVGEVNIDGANDIVCIYSHDNGENIEIIPITETPGNEQFPAVTAIGETVTCTYTRNGNLYTSISEDGGVTWEESEEPLNDVSGSVVEQYHCADIASRYVAWTDDRGETNDIYFDTTEVEVPIIQITDTSGGFGIKATVANTGTADATDVSWTIDLEGGLVIIGRHSENTIPTLAAGEETTIKSGLVLGFGRVDITVTANGASATASGFVLGPFVLGVS